MSSISPMISNPQGKQGLGGLRKGSGCFAAGEYV